MEIESHSNMETRNLGFKLGQDAKSGDIFCLTGDLGAGKTMFVKGFAEALKIKDDITSPTFTIVNEYIGEELPLYHFDVYRINSVYEMEDTGYEDYFYSHGVCLIEWADLIEEIIPDNSVWVNISRNASINDDYRLISIRGWEE